jgi:hypothetical protein
MGTSLRGHRLECAGFAFGVAGKLALAEYYALVLARPVTGNASEVAVGLLFAIAALLIAITQVIRRWNRPPPLASVCAGNNPIWASEPSA